MERRNYIPKNAGFVDTHISYPIADLFSEPAYACGATPNGVTILTFVIRCVAMYYMYKKERPHLVLGLFVVSWFTDALDGLMARKYDMKSEIGAHLDYIVDMVTTAPTIVILLVKYYWNDKQIFATLFGIGVLLHIGQVIKMKGNHRSDASLKPWERVMNAIPIDVQSNALIDANDPGLTYILLLSTIYYGLFVLNGEKLSET